MTTHACISTVQLKPAYLPLPATRFPSVPASAVDIIVSRKEHHLNLNATGHQLVLPSNRCHIAGMPFDILELIFDAAQWSMSDPSLWCSSALIGHVCREWRSVTLLYPKLWSRLVLFPHTPIPFLHACLRRSQSCPLDIYITVMSNQLSKINSLSSLRQVMAVILPHIGRWRSYDMFTNMIIPFDILTQPLHGMKAPILERLMLGGHTNETENPQPILAELPLAFLSKTSQIKHVVMGSIQLPFNHPLLDGVLSLELRQERHYHLNLLLPSCHNLEILVLHGAIPKSFYSSSQLIHLSKLRLLRMHGSNENIAVFFRRVDAPSTVVVERLS